MQGTLDSCNGEKLFGELAITLFMTTRRELERALSAQEQARQAGSDPSLGEVMVGLDMLKQEQVQAVLKAQEVYDEETVETLYGRLAVKNKFLSRSDLQAALRVQARTGRRLRIGEVLVKKDYLTWEQHDALLRAQERILNGLEQAGA